jgi:copper(I)-binding protein
MPRSAASPWTPMSLSMSPGEPARLRRRRAGRKAAVWTLVLLGLVTAAGCAVPAQAGPVIELSAAQVIAPGANRITDVYLDIRNNGPQTKLIGARLSVAGRITFRSPAHAGQLVMRTVPSITIPAKSLTGLDPNGSHMLVTGSGPMIAGRLITITLVFAHAGTFSVSAMVTNPQSGGFGYFLN